jgi:hypothetical protein
VRLICNAIGLTRIAVADIARYNSRYDGRGQWAADLAVAQTRQPLK